MNSTLASSKRPRAFNKFPKSLLTQYKSCRKERQKKGIKTIDFWISKQFEGKKIPDCIEGLIRKLEQRLPYHRRRPTRQPNLCNRRWNQVSIGRHVCNCPRLRPAGPSPWTRCPNSNTLQFIRKKKGILSFSTFSCCVDFTYFLKKTVNRLIYWKMPW